MGVDILGGDSFSWGGWRYLYEVGMAFGWKPVGTVAPEDWDEETSGPWNGSYFSNGLQLVDTPDAEAWSSAIQRALACVKGEAQPTPEQADLVGKLNGDTEILERFIVTSEGGMALF